MRYQGSKYKMRNILKSIIEPHLKEGIYYVEPFMGGCNSLAYINHKQKIGNDYNEHMANLWKDIQNGTFVPPESLSKEEYDAMRMAYKNATNDYQSSMLGYVGSACSHGSGWWNGYAHFNPKKNEDHIKEARNGLLKQINNFAHLQDTKFVNGSYEAMHIPQGSFIYCDPPYESTKKYANEFDNNAFWEWCRLQVRKGNKVLVSEYKAPTDFICIWAQKMQDGMKKNNGLKVEKLFVHKSQARLFGVQVPSVTKKRLKRMIKEALLKKNIL